MKKLILSLLWPVLIVASPLFAQDAAPASGRFDAVLDLVQKNYLHDVPRETLEEQALRAFLEKLDPYSRYMNADEWAVYLSSFSGEYAGVGVNVSIAEEQAAAPDRVLERALEVLRATMEQDSRKEVAKPE